jgi:UDP-N-acetylglucosamine--N-acetylmuramyl-(pentapeptide) pyrophosphoryl-undecaprenol N-acetylglucosamine transferase
MMSSSIHNVQPKGTLMVMAGGTGGHVYPAIAVADYLQALGWRVVWLVTEGGMENRLIADKQYSKATITMRGVRGKGFLGWLLLPFKLMLAFKQSLNAMMQYQPNVVLGMGGFAAFPGGLMAKIMKKPLVIHEQNSVAGLTNKTLSHFANKVLAAFPSAFGNKAELVGNPVRDEITKLALPEVRYAERTGKLRLLVVGGSLGAAALNEVLPKALATIPVELRPEVVHQAGEKHIATLEANYRKAGVAADTKAYIQDMAALYAWADVVVCRAGALTVAELACVGVASVLVPFPHAVDDHQTFNAQYLSDNSAAILIQQTELSVEKTSEILNKLTRDVCLEMAKNARKLSKPEATKAVANVCMSLARVTA